MLKKLLFLMFLAVVFCAVAVSASQLRKTTSATSCGGPCTLGGPRCARPCGCFIQEGSTSGFCTPETNPPARPR